METLAAIPWIEAIPFWVLLAAGVLLIAVDVFLTNDSHVMWIGLAVITTGIANAARLPGELQVLVFAGTLIACMVYIRRLVGKIPRLESQASSIVELKDATGVILDVSGSAPGEGRAVIQDHGEWRVIAGQRDYQLTTGERIRVVGKEGLVLLVEPAPRSVSSAEE